MADIGRPSSYSDKLADEIIQRIASGESVSEICRDPSMPARSTVMLWVATGRDGFSDRYAKACEARAYFLADELLEIADNASNDYMLRNDPNNPGFITNGENVQRSRLRVESRKWLLSKLIPKYADKSIVDHSSTDGSMTPKSTIDASQLSTSAMLELLAAKDKSNGSDSAN